MSQKPTVGIFGLTSCAGCQLQILNMENELLDLLGVIDIKAFEMGQSNNQPGPYDISFIEGSAASEQEIATLKKIREQSGLVIALGACADLGGVQALKNRQDMDALFEKVYGDGPTAAVGNIPYVPISKYIKVDYTIKGCPIDKDEFLRVVTALIYGGALNIPNYAVCIECKMAENNCLFAEGRDVCLGPITRAGCGARCPSFGKSCGACRGLLDEANVAEEVELFAQCGLSPQDILRRITVFGNNEAQYEAVIEKLTAAGAQACS
jgi:sulfhydrogenase subunit delta